jgi:hypothetical protein
MRFVLLALMLIGCAEGELPSILASDTGPKKDTGGTTTGDSSTPGEDSDIPPDGTPPSDTSMGSCSPPSGSTCQVFPQCGCMGTQNCNVTSTTGKMSCVASGSAGLHDACTGSGTCQKGYQCLANICVPFCNSDSDCTISGSPRCKTAQYVPTGGTTPMDVPNLKVCLAQCDPLNPTTVCGANKTCFFPYLSDDTTECAAAGTSTVKGGCATNTFACAPSYICVNDGDCFKWCRIGFPSDCPTGRTCTGFMTPITKGGNEYGVCAY